MRKLALVREEGRMWVFIRPGVVRSANEEKVKPGKHSCPIHRFYMNDQLLNLIQMDVQDSSCLARGGWAHSPAFAVISKMSSLRAFPIQTKFLSLRAGASHHCGIQEQFLLTSCESRLRLFRSIWF